MATKSLARTVIEGGRYHGNCADRRHSHARARRCERDIQARLRLETDFEDLVIPERARVSPMFRDKLGPIYRWLRTRLGRRWDQVRSEIFSRFDIRTTPGRHIVFCHLLPSVSEEGDRNLEWAEFMVDEHGVLRPGPWKRGRYQREEPIPPGLDPCGWLAHRRVGARGPVLFWFTPTPSGAYRQAARLTDDECAFWRALPEWFRKQHDPGAPAPLKRN